MIFRTARAAIAYYGRPFAKLDQTLGNDADSFMAFSLLDEREAPEFRRCLPHDTDLAVRIPAGNFDPPEDHPADPDFTWAPVLINDFSDINGDVGTVAGISGDFSRLVEWAPRVDKTKTNLIA